MKNHCILILVLCSMILIFSGGHNADVVSQIPKFQYGDLSEKEHCITNFMLAYCDHDIERFKELLHPEYSFHTGDIVFSFGDDLAATKVVFRSSFVLGVTIGSGDWETTTSVFGKECEDCWKSKRSYLFIYNHPRKYTTVHVRQGKFNIFVKGISEGGNILYKICALEDINLSLEPIVVSAPD